METPTQGMNAPNFTPSKDGLRAFFLRLLFTHPTLFMQEEIESQALSLPINPFTTKEAFLKTQSFQGFSNPPDSTRQADGRAQGTSVRLSVAGGIKALFYLLSPPPTPPAVPPNAVPAPGLPRPPPPPQHATA